MLIRRCAWHPLYKGYPMFYGVAAWRQPGLQYTDGMCRRCAATALQEWRARSTAAPRPLPVLGWLRPHAGRVGIAVAAASLLVALGLTAAALRDGDRGDVAVSALPRAIYLDGGLEGPPIPRCP